LDVFDRGESEGGFDGADRFEVEKNHEFTDNSHGNTYRIAVITLEYSGHIAIRLDPSSVCGD
jgi:hypothetical protein